MPSEDREVRQGSGYSILLGIPSSRLDQQCTGQTRLTWIDSQNTVWLRWSPRRRSRPASGLRNHRRVEPKIRIFQIVVIYVENIN